jgi:hypothetical protein
MSDQEAAARTWRALARRTVRKINAGWWLQRLSPLLLLSGLTAAIGIIILRTLAHPLADSVWLPAIGAAALVAAILISWMIARRSFLQETDGLVRLEDRLQLRNALTTADRGIGRWPEAPAPAAALDAGLRWNWPRLLAPFAIATLAVAAALLIPIATLEAARPPASEPLAWAQMEEWMELLAEENLIEELAIEQVKENIEELRQQPEDEWFSHSSLEASDTLRQTLQQQIETLGAELATAERDLGALQHYGDQMSQEAKDKLLAEYDQALQNLALSGLPLNPELMKSLKGIDPQQLSQGQMNNLSPEQLQQLRESLKKAAQACSQCNNPGQGEGLPSLGESDALAALLEKKYGRGGISRGPGDAPLALTENETDLKTNQIEGVQNTDFSKAAPGSVLGIGQTEHETDQTPTGPRAAGAVGSIGQGGEAVWRESLMPGEKAVLKKYFK